MDSFIHIILGTACCHGTLPSKHGLRPAIYAKCEHISLATRWKSIPRRDRSSSLMLFAPADLMQFTRKHFGWPQSSKKSGCLSEVSSAMCSILLGSYAPVDTSDGSGTNLNNLQETLAATRNLEGQRKSDFPSHEVMKWGEILSNLFLDYLPHRFHRWNSNLKINASHFLGDFG